MVVKTQNVIITKSQYIIYLNVFIQKMIKTAQTMLLKAYSRL